MYSTLHWSLPKYHGSINDIFQDIQTKKLEDDYVKFYEKFSENIMPYDILVEYKNKKFKYNK
jgi:hypothetical protein